MSDKDKTTENTSAILECKINIKRNKLERGAIAAIVVVLAAVFAILIGISDYNKTENRVTKALDLGQKYLSDSPKHLGRQKVWKRQSKYWRKKSQKLLLQSCGKYWKNAQNSW